MKISGVFLCCLTLAVTLAVSGDESNSESEARQYVIAIPGSSQYYPPQQIYSPIQQPWNPIQQPYYPPQQPIIPLQQQYYPIPQPYYPPQQPYYPIPQPAYYPPQSPTNNGQRSSGSSDIRNVIALIALFPYLRNLLNPATTTITTTAVTTTTSSYNGWPSVNNCHYSFFSSPLSGDGASSACAGLGARLASSGIQSAASRLLVFHAAGITSTTFFVGIRDDDGTNGTPPQPSWASPVISVSSSDHGLSLVGGSTGTSALCGRISATDSNSYIMDPCSGATRPYLCEYCG